MHHKLADRGLAVHRLLLQTLGGAFFHTRRAIYAQKWIIIPLSGFCIYGNGVCGAYSRARVAEYALGAQTTKQGEVIQNVGEMSAPIFGLNLAVRLSGSRPYDEAVLSDSYYRRLQYKSAETEAMKGLNAAVRLSIQQGRELDYDALAADYVQKGGDPRKFRNWIRRHQSRMTVTEAERMKQQLLKSDNVRFAQQLDITVDDF